MDENSTMDKFCNFGSIETKQNVLAGKPFPRFRPCQTGSLHHHQNFSNTAIAVFYGSMRCVTLQGRCPERGSEVGEEVGGEIEATMMKRKRRRISLANIQSLYIE